MKDHNKYVRVNTIPQKNYTIVMATYVLGSDIFPILDKYQIFIVPSQHGFGPDNINLLDEDILNLIVKTHRGFYFNGHFYKVESARRHLKIMVSGEYYNIIKGKPVGN